MFIKKLIFFVPPETHGKSGTFPNQMEISYPEKLVEMAARDV
jgi:hypothetical protein